MLTFNNLQIKNTERPTNNTFRVTASVFPRVRKDNNQYYVEEDLLNNKEAWRYQKEFFPSKDMVEKQKQYIRDYLKVYDGHKMTKTTKTGEIKPVEPFGWVTDCYFSDKYSDNDRWYTGLIFTMRIPKDKALNIMAKYNQSNLYGLHYSISYEPEISWFLVNDVKKPKVTGVKFREVSFTNDPAYPRCKTIQVFHKQNSNENIPGLIEKKNYIVNWDLIVQKVEFEMESKNTIIPNPGKKIENKVTTPTIKVTTLPNKHLQQTTPVPQVQQPIKAQVNEIHKKNLKMLQDEYNINLLEFEKNKNNQVYLHKKIEELTGRLLDTAQKEKEKREKFVKSRDVIFENSIKNYEKVSKDLLNREITEKDKLEYMNLFYQGDVKGVVDYFISLQNKVLDNAKLEKPREVLQHPVNNTPESKIPIIPESGGLLSQSTFIIKDTADDLIEGPCISGGYYDVGSSDWKNQRARSGYSKNKSWKRN